MEKNRFRFAKVAISAVREERRNAPLSGLFALDKYWLRKGGGERPTTEVCPVTPVIILNVLNCLFGGTTRYSEDPNGIGRSKVCHVFNRSCRCYRVATNTHVSMKSIWATLAPLALSPLLRKNSNIRVGCNRVFETARLKISNERMSSPVQPTASNANTITIRNVQLIEKSINIYPSAMLINFFLGEHMS